MGVGYRVEIVDASHQGYPAVVQYLGGAGVSRLEKGVTVVPSGTPTGLLLEVHDSNATCAPKSPEEMPRGLSGLVNWAAKSHGNGHAEIRELSSERVYVHRDQKHFDSSR